MSRYYFIIRHPNWEDVISSDSLRDIVRRKHNAKTHGRLRGAYVSPIYDLFKSDPMQLGALMVGKNAKYK